MNANHVLRFRRIVAWAVFSAAALSSCMCVQAAQPVNWYHNSHIWVGPGGTAPSNGNGTWKKYHFSGRDDWGQRATLDFELGVGNYIRNGKFAAHKECQPGLALAGSSYKFERMATMTCSFSGYDYPCGNTNGVPIQGTITLSYGQLNIRGQGITARLTGKGSTRYWYFRTSSNPFSQSSGAATHAPAHSHSFIRPSGRPTYRYPMGPARRIR